MPYPVYNGSSPVEFAVAITPSDSVDLLLPCRSLFIGGNGNVTVNMLDGSMVVFAGLASGQILPIRVRRIYATGTTATNLVALY